MTTPHGPWPSAQPVKKRTNWGMVAAVAAVVAIVLSTASGVFGDYRAVDRRLTVLEAQRAEDVQRRDQEREEMRRRLERMEDLITKVWERVK